MLDKVISDIGGGYCTRATEGSTNMKARARWRIGDQRRVAIRSLPPTAKRPKLLSPGAWSSAENRKLELASVS